MTMKKEAPTVWIDNLTWACRMHVPSSPKYPWGCESCVQCGYRRPGMELRPTNRPTPPTPKAPKVTKPVAPEFKGDCPCAWPACEKKARVASPYCGKICSDRCIRLRRKGLSTLAVLTVAQRTAYNNFQARLRVWEEAR